MGRLPEASGEWELPKLKFSLGFDDQLSFISGEAWDVKFYPYNPDGAPPIFAAVTQKQVLVCRVVHSKESPVEIIRIIADEEPKTFWVGCCWAKDPETDRPRLCVAGNDNNIRIFDVREGTIVDTFTGHGNGINDLATSPNDPSIIASAADDTTVRIWSLAAVHKKQPCVALLAGEGHSWILLTVAWHETGRYLLSAGHDQDICLWVVPEIPVEPVEAPIIVHYPHFSTWAVHANLIDCIAFLGDCILSRACYEDTVVMWRIEGFDSKNPPPTVSEAPTNYDPKKYTRSAFVSKTPSSCPAAYTRIMEFDVPECGQVFFQRFSVFQAPGKHPVLAIGNAKSKVMFWDFQRFEAYQEFLKALKDPNRDRSVPLERPSWLPAKAPKKPDMTSKALADATDKESGASAAATPDPDAAGTALEYSHEVIAYWDNMYGYGGFSQGVKTPVKAHKVISVHKDLPREVPFITRQVAWSPEGDYCVFTGSSNRVLLFQRWAKDK
ncbi:WD40-repeat-containing domain protein [Coniochaeta sp. 2T2.1]|nr:WD40-repeat-containing domain protein [Coniochaeta sp. 2T2.1]